MPAENLFQGFEFNPEYIEREARRTEDPELDEVKRNTADWSAEDFQSFNDEGIQPERQMVALLRDGVEPTDTAVFDVLDQDLALQRRVYSPDKDTQLAHALAEPSEWREHLDSLDPRLAEYLRDAMIAYANTRME
jgi:hypothetical protein